MEHLLGLSALLLDAIVILLCAKRWPKVGPVLLIAFGIRALAVLIHFYIVPLPYSQADAIRFEQTAWRWAQEPLGLQFLSNPSYFISWILALFYRIVGRSELMAQSFSVLLGSLTIIPGWVLARELWGPRAAIKAAWGIALFPTHIIFSALILREAYFWFFLSLTFLALVRWVKVPSLRNFLSVVLGFVIGIAFHGIAGVGLMAFLLLVVSSYLKDIIKRFLVGRLQIRRLAILLLATIPILLYIMGFYQIPKVGGIRTLTNFESLRTRMETIRNIRTDISYPEWTYPGTWLDTVWKIPIRVMYFLFSPFPWDMRKLQHILNLIDGLVYLLLTIQIWHARRLIWGDKRARWILLVCLAMVVVLSFGTGNFVQSTRHRAKMFVPLIVLASPKLPGKSTFDSPGV